MRRRIYLCLAVMVTAWHSTVNAQTGNALHIGDLMPDVAIGKTIPVANANSRTADYKEQLLILDLWATSCSSCIENMPRLDSLQAAFGNRVKILPVTPETEAQISLFWKKNRYTRNLLISTVVEDRAFHSYFPHKSISHDIWIYKGKVIAITLVDYVNAANIRKVLDGEPVSLPLKDDFSAGFNGATAALQNTAEISANAGKLLKYAVVNKYKEGVKSSAIVNDDGGGIARDTVKRAVRSYIVNQPVYNSYLWALLNTTQKNPMEIIFTVMGGFEPNRVVWEVADRSKYVYEKGTLSWDEWMRKNSICFESLSPDTGQTDRDAYIQLVKDLDELLGLQVRFEKQKVKTLVLTRTGQADLLKTKNAGIDASFNHYQEGNLFHLRDSRLDAFIREFNRHTGNPYTVDGTKYTEKADLDLNIPSWTDVAAIRKELAKYGLAFKEEVREVEMLVFTETGGGYKQVSR